MKRWRVKVYFKRGVGHRAVLVESRVFRFWLSAWLYKREKTLWDNWRSTFCTIVDLRQQ